MHVSIIILLVVTKTNTKNEKRRYKSILTFILFYIVLLMFTMSTCLNLTYIIACYFCKCIAKANHRNISTILFFLYAFVLTDQMLSYILSLTVSLSLCLSAL